MGLRRVSVGAEAGTASANVSRACGGLSEVEWSGCLGGLGTGCTALRCAVAYCTRGEAGGYVPLHLKWQAGWDKRSQSHVDRVGRCRFGWLTSAGLLGQNALRKQGLSPGYYSMHRESSEQLELELELAR